MAHDIQLLQEVVHIQIEVSLMFITAPELIWLHSLFLGVAIGKHLA